MRKKIRIILIILTIFVIASMLCVYSYGLFASRVKGEPSYALPVQPDQTALDRTIAPRLQTHIGQTGLMLLQDNLDAFIVRALTAREAERSLDMQYYIWHDDLTGKLLDFEILRAADRGVRVRIILDDMTAHGRESALAALDIHPNIEIRLFNPTRARENSFLRGIEMMLRAFSMNRRMHNKAWIADGRVAVVGGRNIGDEYFDASNEINFFDIDLLLAGQAVTETSRIFDEFWNSAAVIPLAALVTPKSTALEELREQASKSYESISATPYVQRIHQSPSIQAFLDGELEVYWTPHVHVYSDPAEKAFGQEQSRWLINTLVPIWEKASIDFKVISPYFVPGKGGIEKFTVLANKGVEIEILTNSLAATDVVVSHSGYAPYRRPLLDLGIAIYELKPFSKKSNQSLFGSRGASLHTKAFLIDQKLGFVGSFNFDPRSARLNTEMGVVFTEPTIVAQLEVEFKHHIDGKYSYQVVLENEQILWLDEDEEEIEDLQIWSHEPQTSLFKRIAVSVLGWLPIESQL